MSSDVKAARNRGMWDGAVDGGGRSGGKMKEGHGFCFALMVLVLFCFFRPWQPQPSSSSTTANVTLNHRLQP